MNSKSLAYLKGMGFSGPDADLATSLFEYGIAWLNDGFVYRFIYGIDIIGSGDNPTRWRVFGYCNFPVDTDIEKEWSWVKLGDVKNASGYSDEDWEGLPFEWKVYDLLSYYGLEDIFGAPYWGGFIITEDEES